MMQTADNGVPAAKGSVFAGLIWITYQCFGQPVQLLLITKAQLAIKNNQTTFSLRKLIPRRCSHSNVNGIGVCAIQHAYHSIKSIADAQIWGQTGGKTGTKGSTHSFSGVVGHGFKEAPDSFLIVHRNTAVLLNNTVFNLGQFISVKRGASSADDIKHVKSERACSHAQIGSWGVTGTRFVIALSSFRDTKMFRKLVLRQPSLGALLAQPCANLFGECQYFSIQIFTLAVFCHILRLSSQETAGNCTMPNSTITEQARQQARTSLEKRGQTAKNFAELHNLNPSTVYAVLNGQSQCRRGEAHRAAVLLGIKNGVIAR